MSEKGIYYIGFDGKKYIGQDSKIGRNKRFKEHLNMLKKGSHFNKELQNDFDKYGERHMEYGELCKSDEYTKEDLNKLEIKYIEELNTYGVNGYNKTCGGIGMLGYRQSNETIRKRTKNQHAENNPGAKLSNDEFFKMVDMFKSGKTNKEISEEFGLHERYISVIRHKKRFKSLWKQIENYTPKKSSGVSNNRKINYEDFKKIQQLLSAGCTNVEVEKMFNLSKGTGSRVRHRKVYIEFFERYEDEYNVVGNVQRPEKG